MRIENRSVPTNTVLPHVHYPDLVEAIEWLTRTFGFREHYRYGDPVSGAQVHLGDAWIMLKKTPAGNASPSQLGYGTQSLTIFVGDVDSHFAKTKAEGGRIVEESARDNLWRTPIWRGGHGWPPLALLATCEQPRSRRVGSYGRGGDTFAGHVATPAILLCRDSRRSMR